jgi:hypothetical protein
MKGFYWAVIFATSATNLMAQDLFVRKSVFSQYEAIAEKFTKIEKKNTIGDYPTLQPVEGMQIVFSNVFFSTGAVVSLGRVATFSEKNKKLHISVDTVANLSQANSSDWTDTPCKRENFLWKRSIGGEFKNVNCASINHVVDYFVRPTGAFQQIAVYAKDQGIEITPTIIRVSFTRYASNGQRLVYLVDINPEIYGIDRDTTTPWGSNGWYKDFVNRDSKKIEFLERLKKWAVDVQDRMDDAFAKSPKAFAGLKSIDEYLLPSVTSKPVDATTDNQIEAKLAKFKALFEKGLLTETQYNDHVKSTLTGN